MAFDAKVIRILIASPSDVGEERETIPELINEWNAVNSLSTKIVLMPVMWESHSAPLLGGRPQSIINEQLVKDCDILIGVFWTRIGTNTGVAISGTVEEIEQFVESEKPVMLYFSQTPIEPDKIDIEQFKTLKGFKEKMRSMGLTESYLNLPDFKHKFSRQLSINVGNVINSEATLIKEEVTDSNQSTKKNKLTFKVNTKALEEKLKILEKVISPKQLTDSQINKTLIKAVNSVANTDGWALCSAVGIYLKTYTEIQPLDYGYNKLNEFLNSRSIFETKTLKGHPMLKVKQK